MKSKILNLWMLAAILFCGLSFTTVSCSDDDTEETPQVVTGEFFSPTVNRLIDENNTEVQQKGYAKLVIPATIYREGLFKFPPMPSATWKPW